MTPPSRALRVLVVCDHLGYAGGVVHGGTIHLLTVLPALREHGVEPRLCVLRDAHPAAQRFAAVGVEPRFLGRGKWSMAVLGDLRAEVRRWRPDVLHLRDKKSHLVGRVVAERERVPSLVDVNFEYRPRPALLAARLGRRTGRLIAVSRRLAEHGREAFHVPADRVEALYGALDLRKLVAAAGPRAAAREALGVSATAPVVVVVGRVTFDPDKGHRELLRAHARLRARLPDAVLVVAGDGPARAACEALAAELGLGDGVRFLGHVDRVPMVLAAADVATVPSMCEDALPFAAVEAAALGLPVVAFRVGGLPECVRDGETGLLVPPGDVDAMAGALERLLGDGALRERMAAPARALAAQFDVERYVRRLADVYRELAHQRDGASPRRATSIA